MNRRQVLSLFTFGAASGFTPFLKASKNDTILEAPTYESRFETYPRNPIAEFISNTKEELYPSGEAHILKDPIWINKNYDTLQDLVRNTNGPIILEIERKDIHSRDEAILLSRKL